jgi:hypothetical protein
MNITAAMWPVHLDATVQCHWCVSVSDISVGTWQLNFLVAYTRSSQANLTTAYINYNKINRMVHVVRRHRKSIIRPTDWGKSQTHYFRKLVQCIPLNKSAQYTACDKSQGSKWHLIKHFTYCRKLNTEIKVNKKKSCAVLRAVLLETQVFWDVMLCHWASGSQCFAASQFLLLQGQAWTLMTTALWSFEMSGSTNPMTQCHIPETWIYKSESFHLHFLHGTIHTCPEQN